MRETQKIKLARWLLYLCWGGCVVLVVPAADLHTFPLLRQTRQIRQLTAEKAAAGQPVDLEAVVSLLEPNNPLLTVEDATGGIYVQTTPKIAAGLRFGSKVRVIGHTIRGDYKPCVQAEQVFPQEMGTLPAPRVMALSSLHKGSMDCQWVAVRGVVQQAERRDQWVNLLLSDQRDELNVYLQNYPFAVITDLLGCEVEIQGVMITATDNNREPRADELWTTQAGQLSFLNKRDLPLESMPIQSIGQLRFSPPGNVPAQLIRLRGIVRSERQRSTLEIQDGTGQMRVEISIGEMLYAGDRVNVWGFISRQRGEFFLNHAIYKRIQPTLDAQSSRNLPLLRSVSTVKRLSNQEAEKGYPVHLRGVITYLDRSDQATFFQDDSGGIWFNTTSWPEDLQSGDLVDVEGLSGGGAYMPIVRQPHIRRLGPGHFPKAKTILIRDLLTGKGDALRIELEGVVHRVFGENSTCRLELMEGGNRFFAVIPGFGNKPLPSYLQDARVRLSGPCGIHVNERRQIDSFLIYLVGMDQLEILQPPPGNPFWVPEFSAEDLARGVPAAYSGHRIRVEGTVLFCSLPQKRLYLRDATGCILALLADSNTQLSGDQVQVVGFPVKSGSGAVLEYALTKKLHPGPPPEPQNVSIAGLLQGKFDGELIKLPCQLLETIPMTNRQILVLQAEQEIFQANWESGEQAFSHLRNGSKLEVTGISVVKESLAHGGQLQLLLRTPADVRLVKTAPWLSRERAQWLLAVLGVLILAAVFWGTALRRRVSAQTAIILHRLESEAALERRFRGLIDNSGDLIFTCDLQGRFTSLNPAARRLLAIPLEGAPQPILLEIIRESDRPALEELMRRVLSGEKPEPLTIQAHGREQTICWLEIKLEMVTPETGTPELQGIARDITARRVAEQFLRQSEEKQRQAQKMEALGNLAGGIAHDFNNILTAILGYAELAELDGGDAVMTREHAGEIRKASHRARDLVKQILTFSRGLEEEFRPLPVQEVVAEAARLLRASLPTTIAMDLDIESDCPPVLADGTQIHQVLMNLGTNAYHAMRQQGGRLKIQLAALPGISSSLHAAVGEFPSGPCVLLSVSDTGHGMSEATLARIFEPYFTTKAHGDGSGLGLAVVHGIVRSHKGAIRVCSQPDQGTTFEIYLPAYQTPVQVEPTVEKSIVRGSGRILFVDDEPSIAAIYQKALSRLGYQVAVETSSLQALARFKAAPREFDLLVTDYTMPEMTGLQLAAEIRRLHSQIPMILCTGYSEETTQEKLQACGIANLLMKPTSVGDLAGKIASLLKANPPVDAIGDGAPLT
jgi:PAS domain S-box-containing protein